MDVYTTVQIRKQKYEKLLWFSRKESPRVPHYQPSLSTHKTSPKRDPHGASTQPLGPKMMLFIRGGVQIQQVSSCQTALANSQSWSP